MATTTATPQVDPQDSNIEEKLVKRKRTTTKKVSSSKKKSTPSNKKVVKSVTPNETVESSEVVEQAETVEQNANNENFGVEQEIVTTNPVLKAPKKKISAKQVAGNVLLALAAGTAAVTPIAVYYKNKKYEIVVESEVDNFTAYSITVKRGATISTLKNQLNDFAGHNLVGIYKDSYCTIPYSDSGCRLHRGR